MKLNYMLGGLVVLCLVSMKMGLPSMAPFIILGIAVLGFLAYSVMAPFVQAIYRTHKFFQKMKEDLKLPAHELRIMESMSAMRAKVGDKSAAYFLNLRSSAFEDMFTGLSKIIEGDGEADMKAHFDVKSNLDFEDSDRIVHTIKALTPDAEEALTQLKNQLLTKNIDLEFS